MAFQPYTPKPITDIFTEDTDIDRRKCHRTVPMRVLCLGLGRTGTASLRTALKDLGFTDTYHMMSASVENPPDCLMWQDAFAAKFDNEGTFGREQWDQLLGHCQAVCDWPAVAFAKELIEAYPEAKVVLTTRDVDSWHASTLKTVDWRANDAELKFVAQWDWGAGLYQPMLRKFWDVFFKGDFRKYGKAVHRDYYAEVRSLVPAENLLEYRMGQGWEIKILEPELVSPGYVFLAPYRNVDPGPYIYDNDGQLIWSGAGTLGSSTAHNPHVCTYKKKDHICFFQGHQHHGWARGHGIIMDNRYRVVQTVEAVGSASTTDMHEFRLIHEGKTALVTIYQPRAYDLSPFGVGPGLGWIQDSVFQEIDVETGDLIFEWRALDHIAPSFSYTCIACTDTSGDGLTADTPWDFFHINSIDKNADGDYLISARHVGAVYKISGQDGRVLWELQGANPTFKEKNLHFSSQHHALWVKENQTHTIISLFDNASNTFNITNPESRGMLIGIDHVERTATTLQTWEAPEKGGILSGSQGNMQLLPDGNTLIGWGDHAFYSEHLFTGETVMYAKLAYWESNVMMYRCNKFPWVAAPLTTPSLWTYSMTGTNDSALVTYVSWNGATEVHYWNFYVADSASGPWELASTALKSGFETEHHIQTSKDWTFAEAVDKNGIPLKRSGVVRTFIPSEEMISDCDSRACGPVPPLAEGETFDMMMPEVSDRGANYTRGHDTASYYPEIPMFGGRTISRTACLLGVLAAVAFLILLLFGRRNVMRACAFCRDLIASRVSSIMGVSLSSTDTVVTSSARYRKLEENDGT
ncbi:hypothetical protein K504DRAFT_507347 [Pleomassaria siparia CBS 279.74]|uniref:Uncharacterized protein n=1 Tax=Pleomassaria siparia CBS 279.74 TaxID=1314801 RepID=A0A6G1JV13_9PLEO|nr:hypothetical protein K504DRAFT_507347 [Pleomassaria siparia CBS 279.74]